MTHHLPVRDATSLDNYDRSTVSADDDKVVAKIRIINVYICG